MFWIPGPALRGRPGMTAGEHLLEHSQETDREPDIASSR